MSRLFTKYLGVHVDQVLADGNMQNLLGDSTSSYAGASLLLLSFCVLCIVLLLCSSICKEHVFLTAVCVYQNAAPRTKIFGYMHQNATPKETNNICLYRRRTKKSPPRVFGHNSLPRTLPGTRIGGNGSYKPPGPP